VLADGKPVGRIYENADLGTPARHALVLVGHGRASDERHDERHRRDARRGDGEVSGGVGEGLSLRREPGSFHAAFCRRRHHPRKPPLAKIRPGRPAPAMGPGTPGGCSTAT
jgi:hypothetical protein